MARVLDLTNLAGVYATRLLAEEGHDVIRVEDPAGDAVRRLGPHLRETPDLESGAYHQFFNAGKRSLSFRCVGDDQLRDNAMEIAADGKAVFERLVATADVVVASTPLPIAEARIRHLNPNVVLTIVGSDELPELCLYARTGLLAITGHPGATPVLMGGHIIYAATGLWVMVGTAAAMLVQRMTGQGQTVRVDVQECFETFLDHAVENYTARGRPTERRGHRGAVTPISGAFPCADGYWMLSLSDSTERWRRLVEWMGDEELKDETLLKYDARLAQRDMILDRIGAWAMAFNKQDVVTEAQRRHFPSAPVCTPLDLAEDPQLIDRGFLAQMNHPALGPMRYPRGAIANLWGHDVRPAPRLGEHNGEILAELGYGPEEQAMLLERNVT
jgi:crotonobetainyl-CoA:carnitine CoA-transferase CaiB-like acyl-CoA transferase